VPAGGIVFSQRTTIVDPVNGNDALGQFGRLDRPFKTIQAALNAVPAAVDAATAKQVFVIYISPADYDEDLAIDLGGKRIVLASLGPWGLGKFDAVDWGPTLPRRNIIITGSGAATNGIRPGFAIMGPPFGEGLTTHEAYLARPRISGKIDLSAMVGGSIELLLACEVFGTNGGPTGDSVLTGAAIIQSYIYHSRFRGKLTGANWNLQVSERTRFGGLVDVSGYSTILSCRFDNGMTVASAANAGILPDGFADSDFAGTFTGPAGSLRLDAFTDRTFIASGATLAGGATKVFIDRPGRGVRSVAASVALLVTDEVVFGTAGAAGITLTLPNPALYVGHTITVKKIDSAAGAVTLAPFAAETIDSAASFPLPAQFDAVSLYTNGVDWFVAGVGVGVAPETIEFFPEPETRATGNSTRVAQTVFNGASFRLDRPVTFNRILLRVTAYTAPGSIRVLFYQKPQGLGANATPANLVATVAGFDPGGTGNFLVTPAEGTVTLAAGVYYVLFGRDSAAGSVTLRTYTVLTLDLSNANVDAATHVTNFTTTIAANTSPATFDPRPVATGAATPSVLDLSLDHRLIKV
jgi:hypothetical protein